MAGENGHELTEEESGLGEKGETFRIIKIVPSGGAVEVFPVKELIAADEINRDVFAHLALVDVCLEGLISHGNLDLLVRGIGEEVQIP